MFTPDALQDFAKNDKTSNNEASTAGGASDTTGDGPSADSEEFFL